jgi:4-phytase / acid phosphatase
LNLFRTGLLCSICALATNVSTAQVEKGHTPERLQMVVILSRHGVRSPIWTPARLNNYSALPWPEWSVPPGYLTKHGYELMRLFGVFDRISLAETGIVATQGCTDAAKTYLWADAEERTIESARALAEGLFPQCPPTVHEEPDGGNDPLFHPHIDPTTRADLQPLIAELQKKVEAQDLPTRDGLLIEMQNVLRGCEPKVACVPARAPATPLLGVPIAVVKGQGDHIVDIQGPLAEAASFAEDFLLEYADGMPMDHVGWGKVDEPQMRRFLSLHLDYFDLMHRTPGIAGLEGSTLLDRILRTLDQGVTGKPVAGAVGEPGDKVVVLLGHDTNLATVASLLHLRWTADDRTDDTPPGAELQFLVFKDAKGRASVQLKYEAQTLYQLRAATPLTLQTGPSQVNLNIPSCSSANGLCPWEKFRRIAAQR